MRIIDCHTHIFPDKIAEKASESVGGFYDLAMRFDGTVKSLLEICGASGVSKCLVNSVATSPAQVRSINTFIKDSVTQNSDKLFGFAALHPDMEKSAIEDELKYIKESGLKGIKLHPDFQEFKIDSPAAYKIYERIEGVLPLLIHTGDKRFQFSNPHRLKSVMRDFPKLTVIAAHFGGWSEWEDAVRALADIPNIYVDTSSSLYEVTPQKAAEYIRAFSPERVLFGTDYPMWGADKEIVYINRIPISDDWREMIFYKNAEQLFDIVN